MKYYINNGAFYQVSTSTPREELYHYGVPGMKWGKRKAYQYQRKASISRQSAKEWDQIGKHQSSAIRNKYQKKYAKDGDKEWLEIGEAKAQRKEAKFKKYADQDRADAQKEAAKAKQYKQQVNQTKAAIKKYRKEYDSAEKLSDMADMKWSAAKKQYESLGKNRVQRMLNAARNNTAAAKKYNKMYDEASKASDIADKKWAQAKESYKSTGSNRIQRVRNNIEYDRSKR